MKHQCHKCNKNDCFICEGGLLYCEVCHLGEVELVSDECAGGLTPLALEKGSDCNCPAQHAYMTYVAHDVTCPARLRQ